jgi:hypothetical protein
MQIWWVAHKAQAQKCQYGNTLDRRRYLRSVLVSPKKEVPLSWALKSDHGGAGWCCARRVATPGTLPAVSSKDSVVALYARNLQRFAISSVGAVACTFWALGACLAVNSSTYNQNRTFKNKLQYEEISLPFRSIWDLLPLQYCCK